MIARCVFPLNPNTFCLDSRIILLILQFLWDFLHFVNFFSFFFVFSFFFIFFIFSFVYDSFDATQSLASPSPLRLTRKFGLKSGGRKSMFFIMGFKKDQRRNWIKVAKNPNKFFIRRKNVYLHSSFPFNTLMTQICIKFLSYWIFPFIFKDIPNFPDSTFKWIHSNGRVCSQWFSMEVKRWSLVPSPSVRECVRSGYTSKENILLCATNRLIFSKKENFQASKRNMIKTK